HSVATACNISCAPARQGGDGAPTSDADGGTAAAIGYILVDHRHCNPVGHVDFRLYIGTVARACSVACLKALAHEPAQTVTSNQRSPSHRQRKRNSNSDDSPRGRRRRTKSV